MSIFDKIRTAYRNGSLCEIYDCLFPSRTDSFSVGRVVGFDSEYVVFESFGVCGEFDGYALLWLEVIEDIVADTEYTRRIERLTHLRGCIRNYPVIQFGTDCLKSVISYAVNTGKACELRLNDYYEDDESLFGYLVSYTEEGAVICELDEDGCEDGETEFNPEELDLLLIGGLELECLELLHNDSKNTEETGK